MRTAITACSAAKASLLGVLGLVSMLSHAGDTLSKIRKNQTVTIAYREAFRPFS